MLQGEYRMTGSGPAVIGQAMLTREPLGHEEVESRFGRIAINPANAIYFANGLLGIPDRHQFCLARFPSDKMARFKILQSLEDSTLAFMALPIDLSNPIIERADLEQAARDLDMPIHDVAILLLVTVHRETGAVKLTVNARAPILMHVERRTAAQFVFPNTKYLIRQPLTV